MVILDPEGSAEVGTLVPGRSVACEEANDVFCACSNGARRKEYLLSKTIHSFHKPSRKLMTALPS